MEVQDWGVIDYEEAVTRQLDWVQKVAGGQAPELVIFCSHPPIVTLGRTTPKSDLLDWSGAIAETSRGGRATYHGPNQLVIYPIIDLTREDRPGLRSRDVQAYVRLLALAVVETLQNFGVQCELRQGVDVDEGGHKRQLTGVWAGARKIASLGVAVKKWVTYHGVAINLDADPLAFSGIRPCGFAPGTMVSVEELRGKVSREALIETFLKKLSQALHAA